MKKLPVALAVTLVAGLSANAQAAPTRCPSFRYLTATDAWSAYSITAVDTTCAVAANVIRAHFRRAARPSLRIGTWVCARDVRFVSAAGCLSPRTRQLLWFRWSIAVE